MMYLHNFRMLYVIQGSPYIIRYSAVPRSRTHMQVPSAHSALISGVHVTSPRPQTTQSYKSNTVTLRYRDRPMRKMKGCEGVLKF